MAVFLKGQARRVVEIRMVYRASRGIIQRQKRGLK
jgi:hypothetical protein